MRVFIMSSMYIFILVVYYTDEYSIIVRYVYRFTNWFKLSCALANTRPKRIHATHQDQTKLDEQRQNKDETILFSAYIRHMQIHIYRYKDMYM